MKYTTQHINDMIACAQSKLAAASKVAYRKERFGLYQLNDSIWHIYQLQLYIFLLKRFKNIHAFVNATTEEGLSHIFDRIKRMPYPCDLVREEPPVVIVNRPPTVNAGTDQSLSVGTTSTTLAGTATDPDGQQVTVQWTKVSGGNVTINSPTSLITSLTNMQPGTYVFRLTATDPDGASASDTVTITIPQSLDLVYYGRTAIVPTEDIDEFIQEGFSFQVNAAGDVGIRWDLGQTDPQYCWVAIPNRTPSHNKNKWYVDIINQGNMGGATDLFGAPQTITVGSTEYLFWITSYMTMFSANCLLKKV